MDSNWSQKVSETGGVENYVHVGVVLEQSCGWRAEKDCKTVPDREEERLNVVPLIVLRIIGVHYSAWSCRLVQRDRKVLGVLLFSAVMLAALTFSLRIPSAWGSVDFRDAPPWSSPIVS